ncbi:hypothetical protein QBC40DRAFT_348659 [Triangularia verruculosa]|uniref:Nephrocystin 3-like N-terminal domain-containing protein n=1 Tax=Triangularia verruculosa TaxID=2587418 RepID=A0AAN6XM82_9PEZI|nr:hypothetical protein QBC40DRAFT_348659 [Triangularia verruculosa]
MTPLQALRRRGIPVSGDLDLDKRKRLRKRSSASSFVSDTIDEQAGDTSSRSAMDTIRAGLQESVNGLTVKSKPIEAPMTVKVTPVSDGDKSDSERTASIADETFSATSTIAQSQLSTVTLQLTRVLETSKEIRGHIYSFGDYTETYFKHLDLDSYLEYISDERLIHMPRRGSDFDRVLKSAQFFGLQLWGLGSNVGDFCAGAHQASITALGSTQILLEIGPHQAQALVPTFQALYELALLISNVSQIHEIFYASREVKEGVAHLYCDLVDLVGRISILYRKKINSLGQDTKKSVVIDFEAEFGKQMTGIWKRRDYIIAKMWALKLGNRTNSLGVNAVRRRLQNDRSSKGAFYDQVSENVKRAEDTCEWVRTPLVNFLRGKEKALTITGDPGSGKTVLAGWMKERLQRPLDHTQYTTLTYSFPYDYPVRCTVLAFLKSILFQLLEKNVGNVGLYERLTSAFESYDQHHSTSKLEVSLWAALESGLRSLNDRRTNVAIIIDGFQDVTGGTTPLDLHRRLRDCVSKFRNVRMITLSRGISHLSEGCAHFTITSQHLHGDIKRYLGQSFSTFPGFAQLSPEAQEKTVHDLTHKAKADFLWAYIAVRLLAKDAPTQSPDAFVKAAQSINGTLNELVKKLVSKISLKHEATQALLSFVLAAHRPLGVNELGELLRIDTKSRKFGSDIDVVAHIKSTCGDIVVIQNGSVHFKSEPIRSYMQTLLDGKQLPSVRDAHRNLTVALLLYSKLSLIDGSEPSFEGLDDGFVDEYFDSHSLLYYAVRHWQAHFRASSLYAADGKLVLGKDFVEYFPTSCHFGLLQRSAHLYGEPLSAHAKHHEFSLRVQEACFGERHISVSQTLIILGNVYVDTSDALSGAKYFYRAASIGKIILSTSSSVVVTCTHYFLKYTETITITERTEIVKWREEMIILMIQICKGKHGATSDIVIRWLEVLAKLYIDIKDTTRTTVIQREIWEIYIVRFGKDSDKVKGLAEYIGGLDIEFKGQVNEKEIDEYAGWFLETADGFELGDHRCVSILIQLAFFYESQKQWFWAERTYITLWRRITELCRAQTTIELHISKLEIAIKYVKFLKRIGRHEEASNILICLWVEYEHHKFEELTIIVLLKEIGVLFKAFGLLSIAISVFGKVWGWFKDKGKCDHKDAHETTILITEVVEEITETTVETKTTTTTTTEVTETIIREVFVTHYERCKKGHVNEAFFKSCLALINLYIKNGQWPKAEVIITQSLEITWKAILTAEVTIKLSEHFVSECILVARRLAVCYHHQYLFEKAEAIYLRIFRACLVSLHIEDVLIEESLKVLICFYEEHHRHERIIELYIEILAKYRKHLGHTHRLTIRTMYALAAHYMLLGRKEGYDIYVEIVATLNKGRKHCHHDAIKAAVILVRFYKERQRWVELQQICYVLWEAIVHCHKEIILKEETMVFVYETYMHVLEFHAKVEWSVLYEISVKFREVVTVCFEADAFIIITAMIALAKICERHEKHHHEAVTIYEEVITRIKTTKTTTETVTETTITTVKKRLSKVYVTIITSGGATTTTTLDRAIELCYEAYLHLKLTLGCWHQQTLLKLKDVIVLYLKLGGEKSHTRIVELLQVAFTEIISVKECKSIDLYYAAVTLSSIFVTAKIIQHGFKLVRQLRHLVIFGGYEFEGSVEIVVKFDKTISKTALVFLLAFQHSLTDNNALTFTDLMALALCEITLWEAYKQETESKTSRTICVLEYGAKLRGFWIEQNQQHMCTALDQRLFHVFKTKFGSFITTHDDYTRIFYLALLANLQQDLKKIDFVAIACKAGNDKVAALLKAGEWKKALEVARCTFYFAHKQGYYNDLSRVHYAYKLAEYMAGIDVQRPNDAKLWEEYLRLSREITKEAFAILKNQKIELIRLKYEDLSGIVRLLGSQQNFVELEALLLSLWKSREVQKNWDAHRILRVGRMLVHAHVAAKHVPAAIDLCETMCYNLRRSRGVLDPVTVEMQRMLAELYTTNKRVDRCMTIHEQILREIEAALRDYDEDESRGPIRYYSQPSTTCGQPYLEGKKQPQLPAPQTCGQPYLEKKQPQLCGQPSLQPETLAKTATWQLELLKRAYYRQGGFSKDEHEREFAALYDLLQQRLSKAAAVADKKDICVLKAPAPETWAKSAAAIKDKPDDLIGMYVGPREKDWRLDGENSFSQYFGEDKSGGERKRWSGVDHVNVARRSWWLF